MFCNKGRQFRTKSKLGAGMYGKCYLVHEASGTQYAIKTVDLRRLDHHARHQAKAEVDILKQSERSSGVGHPNIVRYYDSWFRGNELCILMEFCANGNLENYLSGVKSAGVCLPEMEVAYKMSQLLSAVDYCHNTLCVIHRDIKPANVLLDFMGRLKLADFGISKQVRDLHMMAATQAGTPIYMPPEMINGHRYTFKADIWMLGCVIYELMALDTPWGCDVKSWADLARKVCNQPINTSMLRRHYSTDLTRAVFWMLERDAAKRPDTQDLLKLCHIQAPAAPQVNLYQTITPSRGLHSAPSSGYPPEYDGESSCPGAYTSDDAFGDEYAPHARALDEYTPPPPSPAALPHHPEELFEKREYASVQPTAKRIVPRRIAALSSPHAPPPPTRDARDMAVGQIQAAMRQSLTRRRPRLPPLAPTPPRGAARPTTATRPESASATPRTAMPPMRGVARAPPSPMARHAAGPSGYARPRPAVRKAWVA